MLVQSGFVARIQKAVYVLGVLIWVAFVAALFAYDYIGGRAETAIMMSLGPLAMGFIVAIWSWITGSRLRDAFSWVTLCVSLALLIAWPVAEVGEDFGAADTGGIVTFLIATAFGGALYGWVKWKARQRRDTSAASGAQTDVTRVVDSQITSSASEPMRAKLPGLFWLVVGLFLACGLAVLAAWSSYAFVDRGPVVMRTMMGGIHAHDKAVNAATGLVSVVIGWVVGLAGLRYHFPRPLSIGIILGATLLGTMFGWLLYSG